MTAQQRKILLIGFHDGGVEWLAPNPSAAVATELAGSSIDGVEVVARCLAPDSTACVAEIERALDEEEPSVVCGLGVFPGIPGLQVERVAVNIMDFQVPTLDGKRWGGAPVREGGPAAYIATVPVKAMVAAIRACGIPAKVSSSASTHGCNQTLYLELDYAATHGLEVAGGFIHLPELPEGVAKRSAWDPSMSLDMMIEGVRAALGAALVDGPDIDAPLLAWEW